MAAAGTNLTPDRVAPASGNRSEMRRLLPPALLVLAAIAVRVPGLSFDEFRYTYLNQRYWTHSSYNAFTALL